MGEDVMGRLIKTMDKIVDRIIELEKAQKKLIYLAHSHSDTKTNGGKNGN